MKIYIVRHSQTEWNKQKRMQGWLDSPLTEEGKAVAHMIGEKLAGRISEIYTSDLGRCKQTTMILNEHLHVPVFETQDLREQNYGEHNGKPSSEASYRENPELVPRNGESFNHMRKRVLGFLHKLNEDDCLLVTHGGCSRAILSEILHKQPIDPACHLEKNTILIIEKTVGEKGEKYKVIAHEEA